MSTKRKKKRQKWSVRHLFPLYGTRRAFTPPLSLSQNPKSMATTAGDRLVKIVRECRCVAVRDLLG